MTLRFIKLDGNQLDKFTELIKLFEVVFEMKNFSKINRDHLQQFLAKPGFIVYVAESEERIIGGLTAYLLDQYYSDKPIAFIYDVAVKEEFQRQGIGKKLIAHLSEHCKSLGIEEMFVLADVEDEHAIDFYRATLGEESNVVNFNYYLK
ncbi:MAG TPA: GNAT family N-acetyltransferase [Bacteroidia bacterium]|jgi:aminoglycoside 3-N-acetyltransferase I|nr:GNAT family N-acetyltransferase [Bacteroidia bacterium]